MTCHDERNPAPARGADRAPFGDPDDAGCQALLRTRLEAAGFVCETLVAGPEDFRVDNLWAQRRVPCPGRP
jgi:succinyl-diaminopimelate desuccinylase